MAWILAPVAGVSAAAGETDGLNVFRTTLQHARTEQVSDAWPRLVLSRLEGHERGWSIAAFAPVRGRPGVWNVSFTRSEARQAPVNRQLSSLTCPAVNDALSSIAETDMPHILIPGYPSTGDNMGPVVMDGPAIELWSSAGRYFGNPSNEEEVQVTVSGGEHSRFGRAAASALDNLAKCS